jgi:sialidase-1
VRTGEGRLAIERLDLFRAGEDGYRLYRIPALCVTARGSVLAFAEGRNTGSDWGEIDIACRRSEDSGRTFDAAERVSVWEGEVARDPFFARHAHARATGRTFSNPAPVADRDGAVHLLYCVEYARVLHRVSRDDGRSWSDPRDLTPAFEALRAEYPWRVVATGPCHGIQLSSGRLLVPIWLSRGSEGPGGDHRPSVVASLYSDDGGETWRAGEIVARENEPGVNPSETVAAELADGRVLFNIRSESPENRRLLAYSPDGATGWTRPAFHPELFEPVCNAGLTVVGGALAFANPDPPRDGREIDANRLRERRNLTVRLSRDGGATWPAHRVLAPGFAGYNDLNALPGGRTLLCLYENCGDHSFDVRALTLARFDFAWLAGGTEETTNA